MPTAVHRQLSPPNSEHSLASISQAKPFQIPKHGRSPHPNELDEELLDELLELEELDMLDDEELLELEELDEELLLELDDEGELLLDDELLELLDELLPLQQHGIPAIANPYVHVVPLPPYVPPSSVQTASVVTKQFTPGTP